MFDFVTITKNPLGGDCYGCEYCYIHGKRGMKVRFEHIRNKYSGEPKLYDSVLNEKLKEYMLCFPCSSIDYLHPRVSTEMVFRIIEWFERNPNVLFLSLTKNPRRYLEFAEWIPINVILGATIESNINHPKYSKAPLRIERIKAMMDIAKERKLINNKRFMSIEPILHFDYELFLSHILQINPNFGIAIGYDNYHYKLQEPSLANTMLLRHRLIHYRFRIFDKTLRKAWWEK